ncbi:MAG: hypothetical protein AAGJ34_10260 [Pseudomonadota bacterium]
MKSPLKVITAVCVAAVMSAAPILAEDTLPQAKVKFDVGTVPTSPIDIGVPN